MSHRLAAIPSLWIGVIYSVYSKKMSKVEDSGREERAEGEV